ncbi:proline-rich acidic protein 1 [Macrotis lagotis]|uniref:proline-rich acidic protein 1 n=1 Tax=Macrotis lagotis TaxID=92651 RepID=UPI003D684391
MINTDYYQYAIMIDNTLYWGSKGLMNAKRKDSFSEENTNEQLNLGPKAFEQSEKGNILRESMPRLAFFTGSEKNQDLLSIFRNPIQLPEEDRDSFYHSSSTEDVFEKRQMLSLSHHRVLQEPEEDRDQIYHNAN